MSLCQGHCLLPRQQDPMTDRSDRSIPEGVVSGMKCLLHMETERKETGRECEDEGAVRTMDHSKKREREREKMCIFIYSICMYVDSYYILH